MPAIETSGLTKYYGQQPGILDLDLEIERGEVFGFLGPNGAGKTTTIRLLLDLIRPSAGTARLLGVDVRRDAVEARRRVGYLPGELALYDDLTGRATLEFLGSLRVGADREYGEKLADRFGLDLDRRVGELSRGNKQKLGVVQAFLHHPELLILDEPTGGLDPLVQREFHGLVREVAAAGATVFFSSHVLAEVERVADRVGIIVAGRLVVVDRVAALKAKAIRELEFEFTEAASAEPFLALAGVRSAEADGRFLRCRVLGPVGEVIEVAAARYQLVNVISHEPELEGIFLGYAERSSAHVV